MYIKTLVTDCWYEADRDEVEVDRPTEQQLVRAIEQLDAEHRSLVTLEAEGEAHMAVGGGSGRYVVYATYDNETFHTLLADERPEGMELVFVGGQTGDYPTRQLVTKERATQAALTFARWGDLDADLPWEEQ